MTGLYLFLAFFSVGLFKKIVLADGIARYSDPIFAAVSQGAIPDTGQAWRAAICYTLQLYFDFSGYSDMAIGLANLFGIKIPVNFYSPYKAGNISDFWRRWHISLGYFLRVYLYFPFGGSRKGFGRTLLNLFLIMLICGLWHGAGWCFILWGGMHGIGLVVHRLWKTYGYQLSDQSGRLWTWFYSGLCVLVTFLFTTLCWVLFRSETLDSALVIIKAMFMETGSKIPHVFNERTELFIAALMVIVWFTPNLYQLMADYAPGVSLYKGKRFPLHLTSHKSQIVLGVVMGLMCAFAFSMMLINGQSTYLYFEF